MILQHQGYNECYPTTVGMIADVHKDIVIQHITGAWPRTNTWWVAWVTKIQHLIGIHKANDYILKKVRDIIPDFTIPYRVPSTPRYWMDINSSTVPMIGRGAISIVFILEQTAHIVATEDGYIFDSCENGGIFPLQRWLSMIPYRITMVASYRKGGSGDNKGTQVTAIHSSQP